MSTYFKRQWWRLFCAIICFVMSCVYALQPAPKVLTVEALDQVIVNGVFACFYFTGFVLWVTMSLIDDNIYRITQLEEKAEEHDAIREKVRVVHEYSDADSELLHSLEARINSLEQKLVGKK